VPLHFPNDHGKDSVQFTGFPGGLGDDSIAEGTALGAQPKPVLRFGSLAP
jgi:hypothetical protein